MRPYEVVMILDASLEESVVQAAVNRATAAVEGGGGTVNGVDKWGRRRFAYELGHRSEGFYVLLEITTEPSSIEEIDRFLRLADEVVRHRIVRAPENRAGRVLPPGAVEELSSPGRRSRDS